MVTEYDVMSSKKSEKDPLSKEEFDYPAVNPDLPVGDPNPGNMTDVDKMDGPSNVDIPADPASRSAKIEAERNPSNAKLDSDPPPGALSEVAKAGYSQRPDGSDNPARVQPPHNVTDAPKARKSDAGKAEGEKSDGKKTLGREMDESKRK